MLYTHTAADSNQQTSSALAQQRCWSSLPGDLLGEVYAKLVALLDRPHFAAVCASWRAAAATQPRRHALPWLMLDPLASHRDRRSSYCPQDGVVLPLRTGGGCLIGCHDGGWVALSEPSLRIVNLFSGTEIALSPEQKRAAHEGNENPLVFEKIIFSKAPTSDECVLAAITDNDDIAVCKIGCPMGRWILRGRLYGESIIDITFCNGELYGLTHYRKTLNKFEIGLHEDGQPFFKAVHHLDMQNPCAAIFPKMHDMYILDLCGKIVMAVRMTPGSWRRCSRNIHESYFTVFELVDTGNEEETTRHPYKWVEITSLGDHALFLGPASSKVVHVPTDAHDYARRNHIYYSRQHCFTHKDAMPGRAKEFMRISNNNGCDRVYYKEDESTDSDFEGIMSVGYYLRGGLDPPMWIFPPDL